MTQPYLYMRHKSTSHSDVIVVRDIDRQLVQVGSSFGTSESTTNEFTRAYNRVIHWNNDLYAIVEDVIWKYDVSNSGDWGVLYDFSATALAGNTDKRMGLYPVSLEGSGLLVTAYPTADDDFRIIKITQDNGIEETSTITAPNGFNSSAVSTAPFSNAVSWRNSIIWTAAIPNITLSEYNFSTNSFSQTVDGFNNNPNTINQVATNLVIFDDKIYIAAGNNSNKFHLGKLDGNILTDLGQIDSDIDWNIQTNDDPKYILAEVTGCLYCAWSSKDPFSSNDFWRARQIFIDELGNIDSIVDVSGTIPEELRDGGLFANSDVAQSAFIRVDNKTNPTSPIYEIDFFDSDSEGQTRRLYRWNGDMSTTWSFVDAGLDPFRYDYIVCTEGNTERIWTGSGTINASMPQLSVNGSNIVCSFKIYGSPPGSVNAQVLYDKEGETLRNFGTISATSHGTINGDGITVNGLTADGTTEYIITWAAAVDGISTGDNPKVSVRVFV